MPTLTSSTGGADSDTRMVSPMPRDSSAPNATADLMVPWNAGPASVTVGSQDAWAAYSGSGWSLQVGSYFHGFAQQSSHATDSVTVTYWCQQVTVTESVAWLDCRAKPWK